MADTQTAPGHACSTVSLRRKVWGSPRTFLADPGTVVGILIKNDFVPTVNTLWVNLAKLKSEEGNFILLTKANSWKRFQNLPH